MLFEVLEADGAAEAEVVVSGEGSPPYWALTIAGRNTAAKVRENFMLAGKGRFLDCQGTSKIREWNGMVHGIPFKLAGLWLFGMGLREFERQCPRSRNKTKQTLVGGVF